MAKVSGQSYYEYVREHIFAPAGMRSADFYTNPQWHADRRIAHPYHLLPSGERVDALDDHGFIGLPPGGSFASAPDLVRFAHGFQDNELLGAPFTYLTASPKQPASGWVAVVLANYDSVEVGPDPRAPSPRRRDS